MPTLQPQLSISYPELYAPNKRRVIADRRTAYPCLVSLQYAGDAEPML